MCFRSSDREGKPPYHVSLTSQGGNFDTFSQRMVPKMIVSVMRMVSPLSAKPHSSVLSLRIGISDAYLRRIVNSHQYLLCPDARAVAFPKEEGAPMRLDPLPSEEQVGQGIRCAPT